MGPARLGRNDSLEQLGSHGRVMKRKILEVKSPLPQRFGDNLPVNQWEFPLILFAPLPKEVSNVLVHFLKDASWGQENIELK